MERSRKRNLDIQQRKRERAPREIAISGILSQEISSWTSRKKRATRNRRGIRRVARNPRETKFAGCLGQEISMTRNRREIPRASKMVDELTRIQRENNMVLAGQEGSSRKSRPKQKEPNRRGNITSGTPKDHDPMFKWVSFENRNGDMIRKYKCTHSNCEAQMLITIYKGSDTTVEYVKQHHSN